MRSRSSGLSEKVARCYEGVREAARGSVRFGEIGPRPARGPVGAGGPGRSPFTRNEPRPTPGLLRISYLAFALAAAASSEGSAKAITASPSSKLEPGLPPKP
jgi:hypothetical protein